jgi:hypothetical protein
MTPLLNPLLSPECDSLWPTQCARHYKRVCRRSCRYVDSGLEAEDGNDTILDSAQCQGLEAGVAKGESPTLPVELEPEGEEGDLSAERCTTEWADIVDRTTCKLLADPLYHCEKEPLLEDKISYNALFWPFVQRFKAPNVVRWEGGRSVSVLWGRQVRGGRLSARLQGTPRARGGNPRIPGNPNYIPRHPKRQQTFLL